MNGSGPIEILLVDDEAGIRQGHAALQAKRPQVEYFVVGIGHGGLSSQKLLPQS